jgi:transcriptional regulator with XRE-family HTH domain
MSMEQQNEFMLHIRNTAGLDHFEFAHLLGITPRNLRQIECHLIPIGNPTLHKLAKLLETSFELIKLLSMDKNDIPVNQRAFYQELFVLIYQKIIPELCDNLKVKHVKKILNAS